ncbi:hypothetical protein EAH76_23125 [Sphingomonas glacialis]|uniref:Uncharacterized protein n=1 Tax=Sphingomonas glacialis TaxID=658225 RepID=A0A502FAV7_9SPHN|nr:hypothetical protein EAH76_23125 [Sphingomonas glacialis]
MLAPVDMGAGPILPALEPRALIAVEATAIIGSHSRLGRIDTTLLALVTDSFSSSQATACNALVDALLLACLTLIDALRLRCPGQHQSRSQGGGVA